MARFEVGSRKAASLLISAACRRARASAIRTICANEVADGKGTSLLNCLSENLTMNPPEKSDAELALENAQAVVRSALLQITEMHHTLGRKFELLGNLLPSLAKLDKLTLIEGAQVSTLRRDAKKATTRINRAIKQASGVIASLDALQDDLRFRDFGPVPYLGLPAARLP